MPGYRLPRGGSRIDRLRPLRFTFDGRRIDGLAGDTIASALIASGQTLVARSFKYHRPRGIYSAGAEEPNALVTLGADAATDPNVKATIVEAQDGMAVHSQHAWPSLATDLGAVNGLFAPFFAAGFYYKTFMGPGRRGWMRYEPMIRRAAGLGRASFEPDPDRYEMANAFCDVLVVGAGPAGLAAALTVGQAGAHVILCDEAPIFGGMADLDDRIGDEPAADWLFAMRSALNGMENVEQCPRLSVYGYYDGNVLGAVERVAWTGADGRTRQRHWRIQAQRVVLATGAIERPFVFPENDRPGVMLARAALAYARRYGVSVGGDVVLFTSHDDGWRNAAALARAGVPIRAVVDPRSDAPAEAEAELLATGTKSFAGHVVTAVEGGRATKAVAIAPFDAASGAVSDDGLRLDCDALLLAAGWTPTIHLASQAGGAPVYEEALDAFLPGEPREAWHAAGAMCGIADTKGAAASGALAGADAAEALGLEPSRNGARNGPKTGRSLEATPGNRLPLIEVPVPGKAFVDLQNDVTTADVRLAQREGFQSVEHLKRYTTLGMAADQGKTANLNAISILAKERGVSAPAIGTTRYRPPYNSVSLGALVGRARGAHMQPLRRTPLHDWHLKAGAEMINVGLWQRPRVYAREGETLEAAYVREARHVRASVGITDVSTLGKIDVQGPDAATFLDRVYTNTFSTLPIGKARYGLMLRDDGFLFDDGTTWRLAESRYLMTTTTANAALVLQHLEMLLAIAWPELKVSVASLTDQWAGAALAGPKSRDLLSKVLDIDVSDAALPFMGVKPGHVGAIPVLVARLSFSGELAYEIYSGADHTLALWEKLIETGAEFGVVPYGLEALGVLRLEKGHVVGSEITGRTTVHDLGLEKMFSKKKDFVGKPLALRPALTDPGREQLVGVKSLDGKPVMAGAHLVSGADAKTPGPPEGRVTSMGYSPALEGYIALALLKGGRQRHGEKLHAADPLRDGHGPVEIVAPCFFDPDGSRMHG